jgi:hypothetical protein
MHRFGIRRNIQQLALDALFVVLVAHFLATGHIVPPAVVDLLRDKPQVVAVSPADPEGGPEVAPIHNDSSDQTPRT